MPAKKTAPAKKAVPSAKPAKAADPVEPVDIEPVDEAPAGSAAPAEDETSVEEPPLNRAERRARGKSTTQTQPSFRGKVVGGHGPASTQRMWSNRRSGG